MLLAQGEEHSVLDVGCAENCGEGSPVKQN